jgi:hypothetical protein
LHVTYVGNTFNKPFFGAMQEQNLADLKKTSSSVATASIFSANVPGAFARRPWPGRSGGVLHFSGEAKLDEERGDLSLITILIGRRETALRFQWGGRPCPPSDEKLFPA